LKKLSSSVWTDKWRICLLKAFVFIVHDQVAYFF
jgi:hypothetical protein